MYNYHKKDKANLVWTLIGLVWLMVPFQALSQVYYDDNNWEQMVEPNGRIAFVELETVWDHQIITYFLVNNSNNLTQIESQDGIREAFDIWEDNSNLQFLEVCDVNIADIVVSWSTFNHGDHQFCFTNSFHCPFDGTGSILAHVVDRPPPGFFFDNGPLCGDIHFDDSEVWTLNIQNNENQPIDLITVAAHEIGHALGLGHTTVPNSLMNAIYVGSHRFLGQDDIDGINSLYPSPLQINSTSFVCTSNTTFTLNPPAAGTIVTWTKSSNLTYLNGQGTLNYVVKAVSPTTSGAGWVEATISGASCSAITTIRKDVWVGKPSIAYGGEDGPCYEPYLIYNGPVIDGVSYSWSIDNSNLGLTILNSSCKVNNNGIPDGTSQTFNLTLTITGNGCSTTNTKSGVYHQPTQCDCGFGCGGGGGPLSVNPNPASTYMDIELQTEAELIENEEVEVILLNDKSRPVYKVKAHKKKFQISTHKLPNGLYYLHVKQGEQVYKLHVLVSH